MARQIIDCRDMPNEVGCTLAISGEPDEVVIAAVDHTVSVHGHDRDDALTDGVRSALRPAPAGV